MSVRPYNQDAAIVAAVAAAIATSTFVGTQLYELIADTVKAEVASSITADKKMLIPEIIFNVGSQIHDEHKTAAAGTPLTSAIKQTNMEGLASQTADKAFCIYAAGATLCATDNDFIKASTNAFEDMILNKNHDIDSSVGLHALELATLLTHPNPYVISLVRATVCYIHKNKMSMHADFAIATTIINKLEPILGIPPDDSVMIKDKALQVFVGISYSSLSTRRATVTTVPTQPTMGGIINNEAWTGGKPKDDWSGLDPTVANAEPHATQVRATSSKAATSSSKRTQGLFKDKETKCFKHGDDLAYFNDNLFEHFKLHGMDTITYRKDKTG